MPNLGHHRMSFWSRIADRMILEPSRDPIDSEDRQRRWIESPVGKIEAWIVRRAPTNGAETVFAIKFPGTGGRAERGGPHPCEVWPDVGFEIWTINPPGYGGSEGRAQLAKMPTMIDATFRAVKNASSGNPIYAIGNSLGCLSALRVAAQYPIAGLFVRNPLPLRELIVGRYSWFNITLFTKAVARQVPDELDAIENARRATCPAFFVMSAADKLVPPEYQRKIIDVYQGPKRIYEIAGADHHDPPLESEFARYVDELQWLNSTE